MIIPPSLENAEKLFFTENYYFCRNSICKANRTGVYYFMVEQISVRPFLEEIYITIMVVLIKSNERDLGDSEPCI